MNHNIDLRIVSTRNEKLGIIIKTKLVPRGNYSKSWILSNIATKA